MKERISAQLDQCAKPYAGKEEEQDVLIAKERTLSAINALELNDPYNAVAVAAYGSRSGLSVSIHISVEAITSS